MAATRAEERGRGRASDRKQPSSAAYSAVERLRTEEKGEKRRVPVGGGREREREWKGGFGGGPGAWLSVGSGEGGKRDRRHRWREKVSHRTAEREGSSVATGGVLLR